jgi:tetratricopeptide (TPR) repeat protein
MRRVIALLPLLVILPAVGAAMYIAPILETVPIDRLVANLERQYSHPDPNVNETAKAAERLARLHAFAYAQKADSINIDQHTGTEWYGYDTGSPAQIRMVEARSDAIRHRAQQHLQSAVIWYQRSLDLNPTNLVTQLGYGWTLQEAGRKDEAKKVYRKIIDHEMNLGSSAAWNEHGDYESRSKWITAEALDYLIPLLHPLWNWRELKTRREQRKAVERWGDWVTPIVVPLGPAITLHDVLRDDLSVSFNLDGSGPDQRWTWISPCAGWLVCDYDDKGLITSGRKLVGNVTFWVFWDNGFEVLAALDDNADGVLAGQELCGLKIWRDADSDGVCQRGELIRLESCGIVSLSTRCAAIECAGRTMWESRDGVTYTDGTRRDYYDVVLQRAEHELAAVH